MVDPGGPLTLHDHKHHPNPDDLLGISGVGLEPCGAATHCGDVVPAATTGHTVSLFARG